MQDYRNLPSWVYAQYIQIGKNLRLFKLNLNNLGVFEEFIKTHLTFFRAPETTADDFFKSIKQLCFYSLIAILLNLEAVIVIPKRISLGDLPTSIKYLADHSYYRYAKYPLAILCTILAPFLYHFIKNEHTSQIDTNEGLLTTCLKPCFLSIKHIIYISIKFLLLFILTPFAILLSTCKPLYTFTSSHDPKEIIDFFKLFFQNIIQPLITLSFIGILVGHYQLFILPFLICTYTLMPHINIFTQIAFIKATIIFFSLYSLWQVIQPDLFESQSSLIKNLNIIGFIFLLLIITINPAMHLKLTITYIWLLATTTNMYKIITINTDAKATQSSEIKFTTPKDIFHSLFSLKNTETEKDILFYKSLNS